MKKAGAIILSTAIIATAIAGCGNDPTRKAFEEIYGPQLYGYLNHKYYFDGQEIPTTESNFYFVNGFIELSNLSSYGYFPKTTMGNVDLSAAFSGEEYSTYGDYFIEYAEYSIESTLILTTRARSEGIVLSEQTYADIDAMIEKIKTENPNTPLDQYLQNFYGPGMDEAAFRKTLEGYYLADVYSQKYCENYNYSDEDKYVPYVRYALFYAPEDSEQSDKDAALQAATAMKNACSNIDDITPLAEAALEKGTVYDQGDLPVPKGQMVPKFEEWSYGADRKEGEIDIIYAPEYGYFVVGYLGLTEQDKGSLEQIALKELSESVYNEIEAKTHNFHTDDEYKPASAAPTPTPIPGSAAASAGSMTTTDVLIVVLITLAAVAVVAAIIILVMYAMNNKNKKNKKSKNSSKKSSGSSSKKSSSSTKKEQPKPARKKVEVKEEDEDEESDEEDEDSDEDGE